MTYSLMLIRFYFIALDKNPICRMIESLHKGYLMGDDF